MDKEEKEAIKILKKRFDAKGLTDDMYYNIVKNSFHFELAIIEVRKQKFRKEIRKAWIETIKENKLFRYITRILKHLNR